MRYGGRNVSNSKRNVHGHSMMPFNRPHTISTCVLLQLCLYLALLTRYYYISQNLKKIVSVQKFYRIILQKPRTVLAYMWKYTLTVKAVACAVISGNQIKSMRLLH